MWLFLLFVAVPIIEIALFIQVGGAIGLWPTLAIVILTALAGTTLMRAQGLSTLNRLQRSLAEGGNPADPMAQGAMILVAGVLLLTPGFFTDAVGFALLLPPVRAVLIRWAASRITTSGVVYTSSSVRPAPDRGDGTTIDGEYTVVDEGEPNRPDKPSGWTKH
ncbi:MAG: FxsA family protein [Rhodobacteraceae bacterium]|nr:FxsA family protein [Paracoccaceae bacterium]